MHRTIKHRGLLAVLIVALSVTAAGFSSPASASSVTVTIVAGNGADGGPVFDGGSATATELWGVSDVAATINGLMVADTIHNEVRQVDSTGNINAWFGDGTALCDAPQVYRPSGLASAADGTLFVSSPCGTVTQINPDHTSQVIAGNRTGFCNPTILPGMLATDACLSQPAGLDYDDATKTLYIADQFSSRILKVTDGQIWVVAGTGTNGNNGDGQAIFTQLNYPRDVAYHNGLVYIADSSNGLVRTVDGDGNVTTIASVTGPEGLAFDSNGKLYISDGSTGQVSSFEANGSLSPITTLPGGSGGIAFDSHDNLYIADSGSEYVYEISGLVATTLTMINWVALGDSYSSGEGVPPFLTGTNVKGNQCHRSTAAYSEDVVNSAPAGYRLDFHACSGAVFADMYSPNHANSLETQAQLYWVNADTSMVTLTIGGNDAHFADVMAYCATRTSRQATCQKKWQAQVDSAIANLKSQYVALVAAIKAKAPNAKVYLLGYPRFFPTSPPKNCPTGAPGFVFGQSDMTWINAEVAKIDQTISDGAANSGATYVNTYDMVGTNHDLCSKQPWINRAMLPLAYSYHPTKKGQLAIAQIFQSYL